MKYVTAVLLYIDTCVLYRLGLIDRWMAHYRACVVINSSSATSSPTAFRGVWSFANNSSTEACAEHVQSMYAQRIYD